MLLVARTKKYVTFYSLFLYRLFATIDENKDGHLTHGEMTALVVGIQFEEIDLEHDDAVRRIMADFDTSRNQHIDEEEFVNGVCRWLYAARRSRAPAGDAGPHTVKFLSNFHTVSCALLSFVNFPFQYTSLTGILCTGNKEGTRSSGCRGSE
jgi:hypothetical protein